MNFNKLFWVGLDHAEDSRISENDQFVIGKKDTTVSVFPTSPFQFAVRCIQASEGIFIEAVDEAVLENRVGKLALEVL